MNTKYILTVATIIQNNDDILTEYVNEVIPLLKTNFKNFELLLIDNGSSDNSVDLIKQSQTVHPNIRLISLSKEYEEEHARIAILDNCIGDYTVIMDINSDPPAVILEMVAKSVSGYDLVIGERKNRNDDTFFERISAKLFYKLSKNLTGYDINPYDSDFICLSRKMINSLIKIRDRSRYLKYLKLDVGYKQTTIKFDRIHRSKFKKRKKLSHAVSFALEIITTNSDKLLKWASLLGLTISMLNLLYVFYILGIALFKNDVASGWVSSSAMSSIMFFFLFLIVSIISIYLSVILKESKKGSLYYISDESSSSIIYKKIEEKNIV